MREPARPQLPVAQPLISSCRSNRPLLRWKGAYLTVPVFRCTRAVVAHVTPDPGDVRLLSVRAKVLQAGNLPDLLEELRRAQDACATVEVLALSTS